MYKKLNKKLPNRALTDVDIKMFARNLPYFRGVFMKDKLPKKIRQIECGVVNLDNSYNEGTHWVAYIKINNYCEYFDSYGNLKPPLEILKYLKGGQIYYNYTRYQKFNTVNCGHLCLMFLYNFFKINNIK